MHRVSERSGDRHMTFKGGTETDVCVIPRHRNLRRPPSSCNHFSPHPHLIHASVSGRSSSHQKLRYPPHIENEVSPGSFLVCFGTHFALCIRAPLDLHGLSADVVHKMAVSRHTEVSKHRGSISASLMPTFRAAGKGYSACY